MCSTSNIRDLIIRIYDGGDAAGAFWKMYSYFAVEFSQLSK